MEYPILYQKTKTGAINIWRVYTVGNMIYTEFGQMGGKLQTTTGTPCIATNVGRSNERNPEQQAIFEAEAMIKKQLRLKYSKTIEEAMETRIQPMLALDGHKFKIPFPVDVQYKFDGLRCLGITLDGVRKLMSRGNKYYNVKHIEEELIKIFSADIMTDGELYIHGVPLQKMNSLVKKPQEASIKIEYHIYDLPSDKPWAERKEQLSKVQSNNVIKVVKTFTVNSMEELIKLHDQAIEEGYEGLIIRINGKGYEFGKRSACLLKWKNFEDKEFLIVSIGVGTGKFSECPVFECKNDINDKTFGVVPLGDMETKKEMLNNKNIGKMLTVKFIGRTEEGKPKFAFGKAIRSPEDMPPKEEE